MINIPFSPPDIGEEEINEVIDTLRSGWITTGPKVKQFEKQLSEYCGTEKTVCLNSATAALELTLQLLGIGEGDEVITSAYTYTASASVICHVGAVPVLVDTASDSFEMDYDQLLESITVKTKAVIAVELAGVICDYEKIYYAVENKKNLFYPKNSIQEAIGRVAVISDCAHALGAVWQDKRCGQIADFTAFSFHAVKNLTTGEGGAITWLNIDGIDNELIYKRFQLFSMHGQTKDALAKTQIGTWEYDIVAPYYKHNMTDIMAALGIAQLKRYEQSLSHRHEIIARYAEACISLGLYYLHHTGKQFHSSGHLFPVRLPGKCEAYRNAVIMKMAERGVVCNVHYKPLPMMTAYKKMGFNIKDYPNAYSMYKCEITLPLHNLLTNDDVEYVIDNLELSLGG